MPSSEPQLIDLLHLGRPHVIGAWRVGDVIVDPGPSSCLERLLANLERDPPAALALTHIHLDHAGASGTLAERFGTEVWVHERGARHLADPDRLIASARRLYGSDMDRLWGEVRPVPLDRLRVLHGGERLGPFRVAYTPGHASHHVAYLYEPAGWAFSGDAAGVRIEGGPVMAPTPPPEIDLQAWAASLEVLEAWSPRALALTHFGVYEDVAAHIGGLREALDWARASAEQLDEQRFGEQVRARLARRATPAAAGAYEQAMPPWQSFRGLTRYLRRLSSG